VVSQRPRQSGAYTEDTVLIERVGAQVAEKEANIPSMSMLDLILNSLEDDKAEDIVTLDLAGKTAMADYMVVASGRSTRQVVALAEKLSDRLKLVMGTNCRIEGKEAGDWVLIDAGDVIVHLFRPEVREFYQLEKMWQPVLDARV
jgi:ribosome-associated protein